MAITTVLLLLFAAIHAAPVELYTGSFSLNLRDKGIQIINENHFSSYSHVERLDLSYNGIYDIHPRGFCGLNSLFSLDLSDNEIRYLHPDTFKCTPSLERLKLQNNMKLGSGVNHIFLSSASITILDISFCDFRILSDKMFSDMKSLRKVIAIGSPTCQNTGSVWDDRRLECGTIRHIDLQSKHSEPSSNIDHETSTKSVSISVSPDQSKLSQEISTDFKSTKNNSSNEFQEFNAENESESNNNLKSEYISNLQDESTQNLTDGNSLKKNDNTSSERSKDIEANTGRQIAYDQKPTNEQRIDGQTPEPPAPIEADGSWQKYEETEMSEQILQEYKATISKMREIPPYYFVKIRDVSSLDLSDLNILSIHRLAFCGLNSLRVLSLSTNDLQYLHPDTFHCTPHLQKLNLSNNPRLGHHSHGMFIKSRSLEQLDISFCNFASFPDNMLSSLPNLNFLDAVGNSGCSQIVSRYKDIKHVPCSESELGSLLSTREPEKKHLETSPRNEQSYYQDFSTTQSIVMLCFSILNLGMLVLLTIMYVRYKKGTGDNVYEAISTPDLNSADNHQ